MTKRIKENLRGCTNLRVILRNLELVLRQKEKAESEMLNKEDETKQDRYMNVAHAPHTPVHI